jgi:DNA-binding GntR family transcriptional regulator
MAANPPRPAAKDRAYAYVKERILDGRYPGGELLSEGEVAEALEVSRTPVREAFLLLEAEGLMRLYPKRGALIVPVSPDEVRDVFETRLMVETHAARRVADMGAAAEPVRAEMRRLLDGQREALEGRDLAGFVALDRDFHHAMVAGAGNAILTHLHDSLRDRQRRMNTPTVVRDPTAASRFVAEHEAVLTAIERGDAEDARRRLADHLEGAWRGTEGIARSPA